MIWFGAVSRSFSDLEIRLSTTTRPLNSIFSAFAANVGDDEKVVFRGDLSGSTEYTGAADGSKDFDIEFNFHEPFLYDPREGNLMIDLIFHGAMRIPTRDMCCSDDLRGAWHWNANPDAERSSAGGRAIAITQLVLASPPLPGDYNGDGLLNQLDINLQAAAIRDPNRDLPRFDENDDGSIDFADRVIWVEQRRNTYFGDSNLDGEFDSTDLVTVLQAGHYEDDLQLNARWETGDWNGDGEFSSADFVVAFRRSG